MERSPCMFPAGGYGKLLASELGEILFIVFFFAFFFHDNPPPVSTACTRRLSSLHVAFITYILVPEIALCEF